MKLVICAGLIGTALFIACCYICLKDYTENEEGDDMPKMEKELFLEEAEKIIKANFAESELTPEFKAQTNQEKVLFDVHMKNVKSKRFNHIAPTAFDTLVIAEDENEVRAKIKQRYAKNYSYEIEKIIKRG